MLFRSVAFRKAMDDIEKREAGRVGVDFPAAAAAGGIAGMHLFQLAKIGRIPESFDMSPQARELANKVIGDFTHGQNPMETYLNQEKRLEEAYRGTTAQLGIGALGGGPVALKMGIGKVAGYLNQQQYNFGRLQNYETLRSIVGTERVLPTANVLGSSGAAETINRSQDQSKSVLEEVKSVLEEGNRMMKEADDRRRAIIEALDKLNANKVVVKPQGIK